MAFQRGPHVREIFVARDEIKRDNKKSKAKSNKNVKEPVKLGQYKPRILAEDDIVNVPVPRLQPSEDTFTTAKPFIIGDKDTPIVLHPISTDEDNLLDYQENDRSSRFRETDNPVFNRKEATELENTEIINGVVIPPPDYNEEEIYAEIHEKTDLNKPLHKHYGGEDFSKFLDDDDDDSNHGGLTWRSEKPQHRPSIPTYDKKSKTEIKRPHRYQKRESKVKSLFGSSKSKSNKNTGNRNSQIRGFSFADTKTISKNTDHIMISKQLSTGSEGDDTDKFINPLGKEQSYESFLEARHGNADFSNDSGIDPGPDYFGSPPSPQKENNFWKRLTWRFRQKNSNSYYMAYE